MCRYLDFLQKRFVTEGGIKERMYAARTGYRKEQDRMMQTLKEENAALKAEVARLKRLLEEKEWERPRGLVILGDLGDLGTLAPPQ